MILAIGRRRPPAVMSLLTQLSPEPIPPTRAMIAPSRGAPSVGLDVTSALFDHDLRILGACGQRLAGGSRAPRSLVGQTIFELLPRSATARAEKLHRDALIGIESTTDIRLAGRIFEQRLSPVIGACGDVVAGLSRVHEVTQARQSEDQLGDSEERFRMAFEHAPIGKALISLEGRYEDVNPAMCEIMGYSAARLKAMGIAETTHPDDLAADLAAMSKLVGGASTSWTLEKRYVTASGTIAWVEKTMSLVRRQDGSPLHFIAQIQNITERKERDAELAEERRRLQQAQAVGHVGSWEFDLETSAVTWSDTMFELYGQDRLTFGGDYLAALECVHRDDRDGVDSAANACAEAGTPFHVRYRVIRPTDGELRWIDSRGARICEAGRPARVVGAVADVTDVTAAVLAGAATLAANAFQLAVMTASPDIIYVYDVATRSMVWSNRTLSELLGYTGAELASIGRDVFEGLTPPEDRPQFQAGIDATCAAADSEIVQLNHRLRHADGSTRCFSQRATPFRRDGDGVVTQLVGALHDITDAMGLQSRLEHDALHDSLTGLPNRALLMDRLNVALARSRGERREVAVLFCDLDSFKRVNDTAGHADGDVVLQETARRLQGVLRDGDTVARVGGDEFVIIVEPWNREVSRAIPDPLAVETPDAMLAALLAVRIGDALREPVVVHAIEHVVSASIGIAHASLSQPGRPSPVSAEDVLQDADAAMYRAKENGKDRFEVFECQMRTDLNQRGRVERILRRALKQPGKGTGPLEFFAVYQPIFSGKTGKLSGFEALARLTDERGAAVPPDAFISIAEETGLIGPLGNAMLDFACGQLAAMRAQLPGFENVTMAVNVSALQAQHGSLGVDVRRVLLAHQLQAGDLVLELTETALLQAGRSTLTNLRVLRDEGVGIAIDDFGTGYASLRYLATLPISSIKIDKSFTAGLPNDEISRKIIRAVAGLAADMNLSCVAEGVETEAQEAALPDGVQVQGWLAGRPQRPDALELDALRARR